MRRLQRVSEWVDRKILRQWWIDKLVAPASPDPRWLVPAVGDRDLLVPRLRALLLTALFVSTASCGGRQEPPRPVADDFVEVEYPPPPAQVEELQEELAGRPECIWQDGHYEWSGRRYRWTAGEWVVPPEGCAYAPLAMTWVRGNPARLYYTPPRWYRADVSSGARPAPCAAPIPCQIRNLRPQ